MPPIINWDNLRDRFRGLRVRPNYELLDQPGADQLDEEQRPLNDDDHEEIEIVARIDENGNDHDAFIEPNRNERRGRNGQPQR